MRDFSYLVATVVVLSTVYMMAYYSSEDVVTFTVTNKERIVEASGSGESLTVTSKYLVFTDQETFQNTDLLFIGKFNSSDIQGRLIVDSTYTAVVYGWRVPLLSMYRNIGKLR